ncbi:uncharacterized protein [Rutidosis leptorrhynchoides]|uniref:uncharacterized protein n=1 Tax=Rutidosis leptorrhynchoides TaxID=125765 RepID=UPI003A99B420
MEVIAKCGQRPPRVKNPNQGKKRKYNRYPSVSKGDEPTCPWRVFGDKIRANPNIRLVDIADLVMKKYKATVTPNQCRYAKNWALTEYEKSIEEHYGMLRSYGDELVNSNPGSTVKLGVTNNPDGKVYFDRFYVCLNALKEGWKNGCRRVLALDGCFLKKPNQADLDVEGGVNLTLMSDQHKGLIEAVKDIMPYVEHRKCARHIYENFRKKYSGVDFRNMFWAASKSSYPVLFDTIMEQVKSANPNAFKYLNERNPKSWSRAFFTVDRGCEAVENGFSECFNSVIVLCRHNPIITMLEAIRVIIMERMNVMRMLAEHWVDDIAPNIVKKT